MVNLRIRSSRHSHLKAGAGRTSAQTHVRICDNGSGEVTSVQKHLKDAPVADRGRAIGDGVVAGL